MKEFEADVDAILFVLLVFALVYMTTLFAISLRLLYLGRSRFKSSRCYKVLVFFRKLLYMTDKSQDNEDNDLTVLAGMTAVGGIGAIISVITLLWPAIM